MKGSLSYRIRPSGSILVPLWNQLITDEGALTVPVNLSIKNVPDDLAERLRERAAASHRSMQGELMAILEQALEKKPPPSAIAALERVRELGIRTESEAVDILRRDRDERSGR